MLVGLTLYFHIDIIDFLCMFFKSMIQISVWEMLISRFISEQQKTL